MRLPHLWPCLFDTEPSRLKWKSISLTTTLTSRLISSYPKITIPIENPIIKQHQAKPSLPIMNTEQPVEGRLILPFLGRGRYRSQDSKHLPLIKLIPKSARPHFVAMCGEFAGTFLFLFFAFAGTQVANTPDPSRNSVTDYADPAKLLYISLSFGFSLAVNAWVFFRVSGGLFNPAVTLGLCLVGALPYIRGLLVFISQILGAVAAAAVVKVLFPGPFNVQTSLSQGTSVTQGLFIEMFLTAQLVFTIFMLAAEKHKATFIAPIGIGLSLFIAELTGMHIHLFSMGLC